MQTIAHEMEDKKFGEKKKKQSNNSHGKIHKLDDNNFPK